jgi:hypothetical protein
MIADPLSNEERWGTVGCLRTVLVVARTLTSTSRLLESLDLFRGDLRLRFVFTVFDTSRFGAGVERMLWDAGVDTIVPWDQVTEVTYDLALSASENIDTQVVTGPIVLLPHGLGFNKYVPTDDDSGVRVAGLPEADALRNGKIRIVLSHSEQERQLSRLRPETIGHTVVTGDPTYDRLLASEPLRERYRSQLDVGPRRLVLLSSTWRSDSAFGQWRTLPRQLLADLPVDGYRVAMSLHPNIWAWYGDLQIRTWLADEIDAGLILLPPATGWHAALVAADQVIVDHGSLGLFAAGLRKPILRIGAPAEIVPGTPIEALWNTVDRLDPRRGLREQVDTSMALAGSQPDQYAAITDRVFAHVGDASRRLRDAVYEELRLAPPGHNPVVLRAPDITASRGKATAVQAYSRSVSDDTIELVRYPALAHVPSRDDAVGTRHLAVMESERSIRLLQKASVLVSGEPVVTPGRWVTSALHRFPGARIAVASTPDGCLALTRQGARAAFRVASSTAPDTLLLASVAYHHLIEGSGDNTDLVVRTEHAEITVTIHILATVSG